ncbi:hypothetical protein AVEN_241711-1 [Araneus ventricosus]|uniref:Mos1 transposase HTH domain-containing protein n=1 Tax=Araneus ventricosus TaxID=182803 RepID=A0A4Y2FFQ6_ARAVE|nr:hypothetical protein AVEN_241711-1 [Araneus ventricosus]
MDSSRSAQRAVIQFLRAEREHASKIYSKMKEVYGEQCVACCTTFQWCQRYEAGRVNIKDLPRPGQAHVVTNSATISAVDELIQQRNFSSHNPQKVWLWQSLCTVSAQASLRESVCEELSISPRNRRFSKLFTAVENKINDSDDYVKPNIGKIPKF